MKNVLLINGPKSSGKDHTSKVILDTWSRTAMVKFAQPLYDGICSIFALDPLVWEHMYNNHKETPNDLLFGKTPREAMIWLSEEVLKPKFGDNILGVIAANKVQSLFNSGIELVHFSDSGFAPEAIEVINYVGADNTYLLRLHAEGCDFTNDSRSYISPYEIGIPTANFIQLTNTKDLEYDYSLVESLDSLIYKGMGACA